MNSAVDIERQAAQWLVRRDADGWSPSDQAAFDDWVGQSTANRIAVIRLRTVWNKAGRLRASDRDVTTVDAGFSIEPPSAMEELRHPHQRRWIWPAALAASLALVFVPAYQRFAASHDYSTPVGGYQQLPLADGSRVDLNTASHVAVKYSKAERHIRLAQGEAFFKVAKDRSRPFVVEAGGYRVVAVGTAFTVRLRGADVEVVVSEGRVRIDGPSRGRRAPPLYVSAGEEVLAASAGAAVKPVSANELDAALSWREGLLVFEAKPLGEVAAEFNRYNHDQLVVDPSAARVIVDGSFRADNVEGFLRLLQQGFGVSSDRARPGEIILKKI